MRPAHETICVFARIRALARAASFAALLGPISCARFSAFLAPPNPILSEAFELGVNVHSDPGRLDKAAQLGAGWVRVDLSWDSIEPSPGAMDFSAPDKVIDAACGLGLRVYASLAYTPAWACRGGGAKRSCVPDAAAWAAFVRAVALRYEGRVDAYGIWNEPNLGEFWMGSAAEYVEVLLKPACKAIRKAAPGTLVAGPELAHLYATRIGMQEFFDTLARLGGAACLDLLSHHIYGGAEVSPRLLGYRSGELIYRNGLVQMLQKSGLWGCKAWITEFGADAREGGEARQAESLAAQAALFASESSWIGKAFIYELSDDPAHPEAWGLLRADGSERPAFRRLSRASRPRPF